MKGFYIEVTNNLLDPKHQKSMKESVWLFMWYLDKMTSIDEDGVGKVLGGKPIRPEEVYKELGISERTYWSWIKILRVGGYINTKRTSYGCVITVNKAKKRFKRSAGNGRSEVQNPALTKKTIQLDINNKDKNLLKYKKLKANLIENFSINNKMRTESDLEVAREERKIKTRS